MFDLGWSELAFLAVLALVVVGPKDLPRLIRGAGQLMGRVQRLYRQSMTTMRRLENEIEVASGGGDDAYKKLLPDHVRDVMAKGDGAEAASAAKQEAAPQPERAPARNDAAA